MIVTVDYGDGKLREIDLFPVVVNKRIVYRSSIHTCPVHNVNCFVQLVDLVTGATEVHPVEEKKLEVPSGEVMEVKMI